VQQQPPERKSVPSGFILLITLMILQRDAGMVILPAYYAASLDADQEQVIQYYVDICEASPVCKTSFVNEYF
jgi:hypothetical protein